MLNVRTAKPNKPARIMIYGIEGVGKSTLGANADNPIFITPEGGADHLKRQDGKPIAEIENVSTWGLVRKAVNDLIREEHDFKTLVLDSADWLEKLCHAQITGSSPKDIIRINGGYGAGFREAEKLHRELIEDLSVLRIKRNMNIIVTAHYQVKEVKDPDMLEDYDSYMIKCDEKVSSLWREWVDALLFARFKTFINKSDDDSRARAFGDDERMVYTVKRPAFQAKNRYGLPSEMDFKEDFWQVLRGYINKGIQPDPIENLSDVYQETIHIAKKVNNDKTREVIHETIDRSKDDLAELRKIRSRLNQMIGESRP